MHQASGTVPIEPVCVVTALIELSPGLPGTTRRSIDEYLALSEAVLGLRVPLVVFCDESVAERVAERRRTLVPDQPTAIAPFAWHPEATADMEFLRHAIALGRTASTANESKDTVEYLALGWSKLFQMQRAARLIPARQYLWMDIGIAHVASVPEGLAAALRFDAAALGHPPVHLVTLAHEPWYSDHENMKTTALGAALGHPGWWRNGAQVVCGGVIGVVASELDNLAGWVREVISELYQQQMPATDEMILSKVTLTHRAAVRLTDASYRTVLVQFAAALVPSLSDLCPSARFVDLPGPNRPDRSALNPSIANDPAGGFCAIVRHANYRYVDGNYIQLDGSSDIVTDNVFVRLDDDLRVQSVQPVDDRLARTVPAQFPVHGLEDMRLFRHRDAWWVSATLREHRSDGLCEIVACELDDSPRVVNSYLMASPAGQRHEKNWAPLEGTDRISFLWNAEPPVIVGLDIPLRTTTLSRPLPQASECSSARGSSQVIRVPGGWLSVVHHAYSLRDRRSERREYRHRLVHYDEAGRWRATSREFLFEFAGIEFCAGLARTRDGVVMSYGVNDSVARLATISWVDVWSLLGLREHEAVA